MVEIQDALVSSEQDQDVVSLHHQTKERLNHLKSDIEADNPSLDEALEKYDGSGSLDLSGKDITSYQLESAWTKLSECKNLERLDLSNNLIEDLGNLNAPAFPGMTSLKSLDLSNNRMIELDGLAFDPKVANRLERLYINTNANVSSSGDSYPFSLIRNMSAFSGLKHLSAENNDLTAESFLHYNDKKTKLPALESLFLKGNSLVNFDWLRFFPGLHTLDIRDNKFINLSLLDGSYQDLAVGVLTNIGSSFAGIKESNLKKLYLDKKIVDDLTYFASHIEGGDELLWMRDKRGLIISSSGI